MTKWLGPWTKRAADVIHRDFRGHSMFIWKLRKYELEELTIRLKTGWTAEFEGLPSWQLVTSREPQALILGSVLSSIFHGNFSDDTEWTLSKSSSDTKLLGYEIQSRGTMRNFRTETTGGPEFSKEKQEVVQQGQDNSTCVPGQRWQAAERGLGLWWMATWMRDREGTVCSHCKQGKLHTGLD